MGITKNCLSEEKIMSMMQRAVPQKDVQEIKELTEGMCNAAYRITFSDGEESILKIAPNIQSGLMTNEKNLMEAEVRAMRLMKESNVIKVADVQFYDCSKELCDSDYFLMEVIPGENLMFAKEKLTKENVDEINREVGRLQKKMTGITGEKFGLLGDSKRYDSLYEFFSVLLKNILDDADAREIPVGYPREMLEQMLVRDKGAFARVQTPTLVHWDMWEGNIFVKENHVSGVIDWERAMWGEAFMDDRFRTHTRSEEFLQGFGQTTFTQEEQKRLLWYDVLLYLTMIVEVTYRQYDDDGQVKWVSPLLARAVDCLGTVLFT